MRNLDPRVEAAAEAMFELEFPPYSPTASVDSNRWSWRGTGHAEAVRNLYRHQARVALAAAFGVSATLEETSKGTSNPEPGIGLENIPGNIPAKDPRIDALIDLRGENGGWENMSEEDMAVALLAAADAVDPVRQQTLPYWMDKWDNTWQELSQARAELAAANARLAAVLALHDAREEGNFVAPGCGPDGDCDHEEECPQHTENVCSHCWAVAEAANQFFFEEYVPAEVMFPCFTRRAALGGTV